MTRRLFGARTGRPQPTSLDAMDWSQLPAALRLHAARAARDPAPALIPPPQPTPSHDVEASPADQEEELLERVAALRSAVSDSLYEASRDYQMLCNLMQADLSACEEIAAEIRRRLDDNIHYKVLTKLDEVHALLVAHMASKA
jgi:pyruvate/2-oxoglutarate dehydrogenase complex dihydrolipoamide acyltransferase (E2) component